MRQKSPTLTYEHMKLRDEIKCLQQQNQKLKKRLQKMQDAMHLVYMSKKKYKMKFKEVKQKLDILQTIYKKNKQSSPCIHFSQYYQGYQKNRFINHKQENINVSRLNKVSEKFKQNTEVSHKNMKQDITSNTLRTMPSTRKSNSKQHSQNWFFRGKSPNNEQQYNTKRNSSTKDIGKIFKFRNQNQNQNSSKRNFSSGSECENQPIVKNQKSSKKYQYRTQQQKNKQSTFFFNNDRIKSQDKDQGVGLKETIQNLIEELKSLEILNKASRNKQLSEKQKNSHLFLKQTNLFQKLQEVSQKLTQIQSNQQKLMIKVLQHKQKVIQNFRYLGKNNENMNIRMNGSFLKAIEEIGKDLTDWRIDYGCVIK